MVIALISEIGNAPHRRQLMSAAAVHYGARRIVLLKGVAAIYGERVRFLRPRRLFYEDDARKFFDQIKAELVVSGRPRLAGWFLIGHSGTVYHLAPEEFTLEIGKRYLLHPGADTYILLDTRKREVRFMPLPPPPPRPIKHFHRRPTTTNSTTTTSPNRNRRDPLRLLAPFGALLAMAAVFISLVILTARTLTDHAVYDIEIASSELPELLTAAEETETKSETPPTENPEVTVEMDTPDLPTPETLIDAQLTPSMIATAPHPPSPDTVALIKSPVTMNSIIGSARSSIGRAHAMHKFGGSVHAEDAVLRALRYLKSIQRSDGSWHAKGEGDATAFALLTMLAHGETLESQEFSATIRRAIEYLIKHHRNNMAVYALTEAATIIRNPLLTDAATCAVSEMCRRQKPNLKANSGGIIYRYCAVMALMDAGAIGLPVPELATTHENFRRAFRQMRDEILPKLDELNGESAWHYMIAAVCLQYLGCGNEPETRQLINRLDRIWSPPTLGTSAIACCPVRGNYFATTIFFNQGDPIWTKWNRGMLIAYEHAQIVKDGLGTWRCHDQHIGDQPFWPTCYVAMQLMTYYRYRPTDAPDDPQSPTKSKASKPQVTFTVEVEI